MSLLFRFIKSFEFLSYHHLISSHMHDQSDTISQTCIFQLRLTSISDSKVKNASCVFPFTYENKEYTACTTRKDPQVIKYNIFSQNNKASEDNFYWTSRQK